MKGYRGISNRRDEERMKQRFLLAAAAFFLSAASVWFVPAAFDENGSMNGLAYAAGALFWAGLLGGTAVYVLSFRKKYKRPNVLKFFSNGAALVSDGVLLISAGVTGYAAYAGNVERTVILGAIFFLLLSLYFHFLLNGQVFTDIVGKRKGKGNRT